MFDLHTQLFENQRRLLNIQTILTVEHSLSPRITVTQWGIESRTSHSRPPLLPTELNDISNSAGNKGCYKPVAVPYNQTHVLYC